jgi:hypothetical protein
MRLLTRSDFDGICCAVLLKELGLMTEMVYAHPKDLQDGKVPVGSNDILANVPYVPGCGLWFDHHSSEMERNDLVDSQYEGLSKLAPSAARVITDYYGEEKFSRFRDLLESVDKVDSAQLTEDEILNPTGWVLLGFICDPRTGLGYNKSYTISSLQFCRDLVDMIGTMSLADILAHPDTKERSDLYFESTEKAKKFYETCTWMDGPIAVSDFRIAGMAPPSNRFLVYSLYPEANISIRMIDGKDGKFVSFSVGHSVLNRTSTVDVGSLMLKYGGGGHKAVGTCQIPYEEAEDALHDMSDFIRAQG